MFHGGTNFGFSLNSCSNYNESSGSDVTSYDYDAPLTEDGQMTENIMNSKTLFPNSERYRRWNLQHRSSRKTYGTLRVKEKAGLFDTLDTLDTPVKDAMPLSMEETGQDYGYVLFVQKFPEGKKSALVRYGAEPTERLFLQMENRQRSGMIMRWTGILVLNFRKSRADWIIFMENMGRVQLWTELELQKKGITHGYC